MTRNEAFKWLKVCAFSGCEDCENACMPIEWCDGKMQEAVSAIESTQDGDAISRAELFNKLAILKAPPEANEYKTEVYRIINDSETVTAGVIRCKDCRFWKSETTEISYCDRLGDWFATGGHDYCSFAEREANGENN